MRILYILVCTFLLASCGDNGQQAEAADQTDVVDTTAQEVSEPDNTPKNYQFPEIEGKKWEVISLEINGDTRKPMGDDIPTMMIEEGKISGNAGCNNYNGSVQLSSDGSMSVGQLASTKKICQNKMTKEQQFLDLLQGAQSYSVNKIFLEINAQTGKLSLRTEYKPEE